MPTIRRSVLADLVRCARRGAWSLGLLAAGGLFATDTVLLTDQFTDDNHANQSLTQSARWFSAGGPAGVTRLWTTPPALGGELRMVAEGNPGSAAMALAYFTASGSPRALAAGESLTVEFTLRLEALRDGRDNLRFAIMNSGAYRATADSEAGVFNSAYANNHSGYQIALNTGATSSAFNIHERNNQGSTTPFALGARLGADNFAALNLPVKVAIPVRLVLTRATGAGTSLTLAATVNGVTVTRTDTGGLITSFDCLGVYFDDDALSANQALRLDDVTVRHATAAATPVVTTLLEDAFADDERLTQFLPASARWFYGGQAAAANRLTTAPGPSADDLVFTPGGVDAMTFAYFTATGSPRALAVGESLNIQANLRLDVLANAPDGLRFGLFDSQSVRAAADITAGIGSTATFNNTLGYSAWLNPGASGGFNLHRRATSGAHPFTPASNTRLGADNTAAIGFRTSPDRVARLSFTVTRLASGLRIESAINGRGVVRIDTAPATTAFDTFALFVSSTALYAGPQLYLDNINVVHVAVPPPITSGGAILAQNFEGPGWASAAFAGSGATGTVTSGEHGTINVRGGIVRSGGLRLELDSAGAAGPWSGALESGLLPITNGETMPGKLTLAFDLLASSARPVRVRLESASAAGVVGGALERLVFPHAPDAFQRFAFELSDMTPVSGAFDPAAPNLRLRLAIEGGFTGPDAWPAGAHSLQLDNVYYARPAYYVKPGGNDGLAGTTEATAYATIAKALSVAGAGDIIVMMEGATSPAYTLGNSLAFSRGGAAAGWLTLKNYPGHRPLLQRLESTGGSYNAISIARGVSGSIDTTTSLNYIELRGFRLRGTADTLAVADRGGFTAKANMTGIAYDGRYMALPSHHIRVADTEVFNFAGGGIIGIDSDWVYLENNEVHDTCNWTVYAPSGISQLRPYNFDGTAGTHRIFWVGNRVYRNECKEPWAEAGRYSDGNGAILDTFLDTPYGSYLGRSLVANNLFYQNGGSGIHALKVDGADIVHNTAYYNSASPFLNYGSIYASLSNDIVVANNIIVAGPGEPLNNGGYDAAYPRTTGVRFLNNLYHSADGSVAPYSEPGASGNLTATSAAQVNFSAPASGDFRLLPGSLALDAATTAIATAPRRDFAGRVRAAEGTPSIGALEPRPAPVQPADGVARAYFTDGNGSLAAQQFPGDGGDGWIAGWTLSAAATGTTENTAPLSAGAAGYLKISRTGGTLQEGVSRPWSAAVRPLDQPARLAFQIRLDAPLTTFDAAGDTLTIASRATAAAGAGGDANFIVRAFGAATANLATREWGVFNGDPGVANAYDAARFLPTGVILTPGTVYTFTVDLHAAPATGVTGGRIHGTYDVTIAGGGQTGKVTGLGFRSAATTLGGYLTFATEQSAATDALAFSVDSIELAPLSPAPLSTRERWLAAHFGVAERNNPALETTVWGDFADPDADGVVNLLEYAFAGAPSESDTGILPVGQVSDLSPQPSFLTLTFLRARADLTYIVQGSSDLLVWDDLVTNPGEISSTTPVVFTDSVPLSGPEAPRRFLRLRVVTR